MPAPANSPNHTGKILLIILLIFAAGLAGYGYLSQTSNLHSNSTSAAEAPASTAPAMAKADDPIYIASPNDIVIGAAEAPITILDYSSLSCPHCADFHANILPELRKRLLDVGKAKLVYRHFPLNEPALRAAQLVECSGLMKREAFLKALFETQKNWAFSDNFKDSLKAIANEGGMDAAAFDSCLADKSLEDAILKTRQDAESKLLVDGTPAFYVGPTKIKNFSNANAFIGEVEAAGKPAAPTVAAPAEGAPAAAPASAPAATTPPAP